MARVIGFMVVLRRKIEVDVMCDSWYTSRHYDLRNKPMMKGAE